MGGVDKVDQMLILLQPAYSIPRKRGKILYEDFLLFIGSGFVKILHFVM